MTRFRRFLLFISGLGILLLLPAKALAQKPLTHEEARALDHQSPAWGSVRAHLPDPGVSSGAQLESAADILRARRFLEDALDYYGYALNRGGDPVRLLNKMGVTQLELRDFSAARVSFQRAIKTNKKNPEGWNNLGVIEYLSGRFDAAIGNYKRAIKLDKKSATYHSNMGTALFDRKEFDRARKEYDIALKLDPDMLQHHGSLGITTRMLSPEDHARFCFELARLYAQRGDDPTTMRYLTMASEAGFDILSAMGSDDVFASYRKDPRILVIVKNSKELRERKTTIAEGSGPPPPLPPEKH
ncbi:tetratricopeptide repeat protein [Edaphobacter albus]|uniref:tetratricopeptide repeat protein n=1 Tax=Edaphobacter sp. 4G125 TaxID=2763071 RepID=UPI00164910EC|nr:tetratricopeptide repeat protein [Edaphobacter sp. 4G125]QNI37817.1 tetratricopeptide repeat protein [Edaphobacter sp. 4G125]